MINVDPANDAVPYPIYFLLEIGFILLCFMPLFHVLISSVILLYGCYMSYSLFEQRYDCAINIEDLIKLEDVMAEHSLGPNGGITFQSLSHFRFPGSQYVFTF